MERTRTRLTDERSVGSVSHTLSPPVTAWGGGQAHPRIPGSRAAVWLRLFRSRGETAPKAALGDVRLPGSILSINHSTGQLMDAYSKAAEEQTPIIVFDGHGRPPERTDARAGLAVRSTVIGPDDLQPNLDCELLILGACYQRNPAYFERWQRVFPNAVIVAAREVVPDAAENGCALIANLVRVAIDEGPTNVGALRSTVSSFRERFPTVKKAKFRVIEPNSSVAEGQPY